MAGSFEERSEACARKGSRAVCEAKSARAARDTLASTYRDHRKRYGAKGMSTEATGRRERLASADRKILGGRRGVVVG